MAISKAAECHQALKESEDMDRLKSFQVSEFVDTNRNLDL